MPKEYEIDDFNRNGGGLKTLLNENRLYTERDLDFKDSNSTGTVKEIKFDSIHIMRISLKVAQEMSIPFVTTDRRIVLFFSLQGNSLLNTNYTKNLSLNAGTHNIIYTSQSPGSIRCFPGKYEVFYIGMSPELFKSYFPRDEAVFAQFDEQMNCAEFSLLRKEHGVINRSIIRVIEDICHYDSRQSIKQIYLIAKVIELISLQLGELCMICNPLPIVRAEDVEKMYEVKNFILNHLNENHSLGELAQIVGTNEYTLKKEFKELFGTTVFGFWGDAKMDNARKILAETNADIKEISESIGYKNPQHFSSAFKRKFGITPSQFRKSRE